jgi:hypothetical protein
VDGKGNLCVADKLAIREIDAHGVVSTLAGSPDQIGSTDGTGSAARFSNPREVAVDFAGNVYVADDGNKNIRKITPAGVVRTLRDAGNGSSFVKPVAVAADDKGRIYVADEDGFSILVGNPSKQDDWKADIRTECCGDLRRANHASLATTQFLTRNPRILHGVE